MNYNTNINPSKIVLISSENEKGKNKIIISDNKDYEEFNYFSSNEFPWVGKKEVEDFEIPQSIYTKEKEEKIFTEISKKETEQYCETKIDLQNNEDTFINKENNNNSNSLLNKKTRRLNESPQDEGCIYSKKQKNKKKFFNIKTMENKDKKIKQDHHIQNKNELFTISKIIRFYPPYAKKGS